MISFKNNPFLRRSFYLVARFLSVINEIVPKDKNMILFIDNNNTDVYDNSEAILNYISQNDRSNKKIILCVPKSNDRSKHVGTLKGVLYFLRAKYVFYSFGEFRIKPSRKQIVAFQNHGSPLKSMGITTGYASYTKERIDNFTFAAVTSPLFIPIISKAYGCEEDRVKVLGQARCDYFYSQNDGIKDLIDRTKYKKMILWMPTFRLTATDSRFKDGQAFSEETGLPLIATQKDLQVIDTYLQSIGVLLCIKLHPYSELKDNNLTNIITIKNPAIFSRGIKLYEFVKEFDALLTDYSTISWDYIMLDRPMGYTLDDMEKYSRGFSFDNILDYMPGHHIFNMDDLKSYFRDVADNNDRFRDQRRKVCKEVNTYVGYGHCKRLIDFCGINLEK